MLPHLNAAYNLARWLTHNEQDAEDIVQEAYLRALRFFDGFQGGDGKAWLLAIVRNTWRTWRRRAQPFTTVEFDENAHAVGEGQPASSGRLQAASFEGVRECLEKLPAPYREIVILREIEEMRYQDIA